MKKVKNAFQMLMTGSLFLSVMFLSSCSKNIKDTAAPDASSDKTLGAIPIALWNFDSTWQEAKQNLAGRPHKRAKYSSTPQAHAGIAAFKSNDSGFVSYANDGTAINNLTTAFTVDFWVFAERPLEGGAQCLFCIPQTGAFWPTQHVLLDAYSQSQGDTALIKVMFKANRPITYNEQWNVVGGIPNFYHRWSHIQYDYNGSTSKYTFKVNGVTYLDHITLYDNDPMMGGQPLGNIVANPNPQGVVVGAFQNQWQPVLFGVPEVWMLTFKGRIDELKMFNTAIF